MDDASSRGARRAGAAALRPTAIVMTAATGVVLVGVFGPWLRSGSARRSSFDLFDLAERLGFATDGLFGWAVRLWPLVPLLVVGAAVAEWLRRPYVSGMLAIVAGLYVGGVAFGVSFAPDAGLIRTEWGVTVAGIGAAAMIVSGAWTLATLRRWSKRSTRPEAAGVERVAQ